MAYTYVLQLEIATRQSANIGPIAANYGDKLCERRCYGQKRFDWMVAMRIFHRPLELIYQCRKPYVVLNVCFYGLIVCGMLYAAFNRDAQQSLGKTARGQVASTLPHVAAAYSEGHVFAAFAWTFAINLLLGSFATIVFPSLILPFSGLCLGMVRAFAWGLIFSPASWPTNGASAIYGLLIFILLAMEGQGFILAMLAAYVQSARFLKRPEPPGSSWWRRYWSALKQSAQLYPVVAVQLALAAFYESLLVIVLLPLLK